MKTSLRGIVRRAQQYRARTGDDKTAVSRAEMSMLLRAAGMRKTDHFRQIGGMFRLDVIYRGERFVCAAKDTMGALFPRRGAA